MVKRSISVFARLKPPRRPGSEEERALFSLNASCQAITFTLVKKLGGENYIKTREESQTFRFERVFNQNSKQNEIFSSVAEPIIDNVIEGYNGTIFAYGQTGSGKTFTITGGPSSYAERGVIPRTIDYVFQKTRSSPNMSYTVYVSYLEIYNECGYDLLHPQHQVSNLEDLPRVVLLEDKNQRIHLKNLSMHLVQSKEEALNLLFLGDTNRVIAETPMNQASSRSHCVFTLHLAGQSNRITSVRQAKLHLVDLAGSERVYKTGIDGHTLVEARYINLSLHYLEQVILALSEKNRGHVPYRNSMMTSVLRDSLGGNCMTSMIATLSLDKNNLEETLSTCRFSQRVSLIKNEAKVNEELNPHQTITLLREEVRQLKNQICILSNECIAEELTQEDITECEKSVSDFLKPTNKDIEFSLPSDVRKIQQCFKILRAACVKGKAEATSGECEQRSDAVERLQQLIIQRDKEISILVSLLKKEKKRTLKAITALDNFRTGGIPCNSAPIPACIPNFQNISMPLFQKTQMNENSRNILNMDIINPIHTDKNVSTAEKEAFDNFYQNYKQRNDIERCKTNLSSKYEKARTIGKKIHHIRRNIVSLKEQLEKLKSLNTAVSVNEIENVSEKLRLEQKLYQDSLESLQDLKLETEHIQHSLQQSNIRLTHDFREWRSDKQFQSSSGGHTDTLRKSSFSGGDLADSSFSLASHFSASWSDSSPDACLSNQLMLQRKSCSQSTDSGFYDHAEDASRSLEQNGRTAFGRDLGCSGEFDKGGSWKDSDELTRKFQEVNNMKTKRSLNNVKLDENTLEFSNTNKQENNSLNSTFDYFASQKSSPLSGPSSASTPRQSPDMQSSPQPVSSSDDSNEGLPLTGDKEIDDEIRAFYRARKKLFNVNK